MSFQAYLDTIEKKTGLTPRELLEIAKARGLNEGNVRVEYARWRKFFGITGRIGAPGSEKGEGEA